jgi:hypothetical protein
MTTAPVTSVEARKRNRNLLETNRRHTHMTHTPIHHLAVGILAIAVAGVIWLALSTTTVPASARTFNFNSGGSMVQQSLPPQWACELSRALGERTLPCRNSVVR